MNSIETHSLSYEFSPGERILNDVNLNVPKGSIYGFLGPNGAGKTTTIRLLLGLLKKQSGIVNMLGKDFHSNRVEVLSKVGSLIESPSLYAHLSARENLMILQKVYQCPESRINEVLEMVDLHKTAKKNAGKFSLGMKQRLSLAMALLHEPELLILDEPTNGLDPNGILEMRELLKKLNREKGITILVSSHLLSEVEKLVSHVGIIHKGTLLFQGTLEELTKRQNQLSGIEITTSNALEAQKLIAATGTNSSVLEDKLVFDALPKEKIAAINKTLVEKGLDVYSISVVNNDLESIFMDMVNK